MKTSKNNEHIFQKFRDESNPFGKNYCTEVYLPIVIIAIAIQIQLLHITQLL